jgi:hypothetical protein
LKFKILNLKLKILCLSFVVFCAVGLLAQSPCTPQQAQAKPGRWARATDDLAMADGTFPKAQYPVLLRKGDRVIELLQQANPSPTGLEARAYHNIRGNSYTANGPVPFGVTALYLSYYCVPDKPDYPGTRGKIRTEDETQTWIYVSFNSLGWLEQEKLLSNFNTTSGATILVEPRHVAEFQGYTLYLPKVHTAQLTEAIVMTPDGRSPYKPISREQYLRAREKFYDGQIAEVEKELAHQGEFRDRGIAAAASRQWSAEKKAQEKQSYIKGYESAAHGLENRRQQIEGNKAKIAAAIEAMSVEERKLPAIVRDPNVLPGGRDPLFATEEQGGKRLATLDRSLFPASAPRDKIQMAVIYWRWKADDTNKREMIRQFKERFDFKAVQTMIGH